MALGDAKFQGHPFLRQRLLTPTNGSDEPGPDPEKLSRPQDPGRKLEEEAHVRGDRHGAQLPLYPAAPGKVKRHHDREEDGHGQNGLQRQRGKKPCTRVGVEWVDQMFTRTDSHVTRA